MAQEHLRVEAQWPRRDSEGLGVLTTVILNRSSFAQQVLPNPQRTGSWEWAGQGREQTRAG